MPYILLPLCAHPLLIVIRAKLYCALMIPLYVSCKSHSIISLQNLWAGCFIRIGIIIIFFDADTATLEHYFLIFLKSSFLSPLVYCQHIPRSVGGTAKHSGRIQLCSTGVTKWHPSQSTRFASGGDWCIAVQNRQLLARSIPLLRWTRGRVGCIGGSDHKRYSSGNGRVFCSERKGGLYVTMKISTRLHWSKIFWYLVSSRICERHECAGEESWRIFTIESHLLRHTILCHLPSMRSCRISW